MGEAMPIKLQVLALIIGVVFALFVFSNMKRSAFRPSFAFLWLCMASFLISVPIFEAFYRWLAIQVLGFEAATFLIFVAAIGFLMIYVFFITIRITQMADKIQALISQTAILEEELKEARSRE